MSKPRIFYNCRCIICNGVEIEMVSVGALVLCNTCYKTTFKTEYPVKEERELYLELLEKQKQRDYNDFS